MDLTVTPAAAPAAASGPAQAAPPQRPTPHPSDRSAASLALRLKLPLRPTVPLSETADMTAMERTMWEIHARSETALYAQTRSLTGPDVASLIQE